MDIETAAAVHGLRGDIGRVESTLRSEIGNLRHGLKSDITDLRTELKGDIADLRTELKGDIAATRDEVKRHAETLYESLHGDIRILAEGFAAISVKLDSLQR